MIVPEAVVSQIIAGRVGEFIRRRNLTSNPSILSLELQERHLLELNVSRQGCVEAAGTPATIA